MISDVCSVCKFNSGNKTDDGTSDGAIIAVIVGVSVIGVAGIGVVAYTFLKKKKS